MHCKSGADRAGIMSVLYRHYRLGLPIEEALEQLSFKYLHIKQGKTGVLDYTFERYLTDAAPRGLTFAMGGEPRLRPREDQGRLPGRDDPAGS